jgi:hypothetical protein
MRIGKTRKLASIALAIALVFGMAAWATDRQEARAKTQPASQRHICVQR